ALASPAVAGVVHDESVDGDLATNPAAPTPLAFTPGGSSVIGTVSNVGTVDRDYITFTIGPLEILTALNLVAISPDNLAFAALNAGTTSFVPDGSTIGNFLAGIHIAAAQVGTDLMPLFVSSSVTTNSLPAPFLGPGDYCFVIQQTSPITQSYSLEFFVESAVRTESSTWGRVKALYR
ncbi:MAG TPA: hypothetical protein VFT13_08700, partial [Candidatus Krumholzibacteria bacterium]|nr:hypothetical protein [Candidatus Krumholzibacteria bacterium]